MVDYATAYSLLKRAREAQTENELAFIAVNELRNLLPYRQAVLWCADGKIGAISGVASVDANAPMPLFLKALHKALRQNNAPNGMVAVSDLPQDLQSAWEEWLPLSAYWGRTEHGLDFLIAGDEAWTEETQVLLQDTLDGFAHANDVLRRKQVSPFDKLKDFSRRKVVIGGAVAVVLLGCLPVPLTVLAPAEIVPFQPEVVRASLDGVVAQVHVQPNQDVKTGQALFDLDDRELRSQMEVTQQNLATSQAQFEQTTQKAFYDLRAKSELVAIKGRMQEHESDIAYLQDLLSRTKITAQKDGVILMDDPSQWIGKPVTIGEKVLLVANPQQVEVEALMTVEDAVALPAGASLRLFLNTDPLSPVDGAVRFAAYKAYTQPDGTLAYQIRAQLVEGERIPRLGMKGTARIEAGRVSLAYWVLRRPLGAIRQFLGW